MADPWLKFYPQDWRADERLRNCSLMARGLWMEMIALMHRSDRYGHLLVNGKQPSVSQLAVQVGATIEQVEAGLSELESEGVFSRDRNDAIYSRRMIRDEKKGRTNKKNGHSGGNPELRRGSVPKSQRIRPYRRSDNPAKTLRIFERGGGKCHWCKCDLVFESKTLRPDLFHVDHVVPVCDGGTNDEDNLVSACAKCNHARARNDWENPSDTNSGGNSHSSSDAKAQIPEARSQRTTDKSVVSAKVRLPDGWEPEPFTAGTQCRSIVDGWSPSEFERQVESFKAHHEREGSKFVNWQAAWKTWALNSVKFGNQRDRDGGSTWRKSEDLLEIVIRENGVKVPP